MPLWPWWKSQTISCLTIMKMLKLYQCHKGELLKCWHSYIWGGPAGIYPDYEYDVKNDEDLDNCDDDDDHLSNLAHSYHWRCAVTGKNYSSWWWAVAFTNLFMMHSMNNPLIKMMTMSMMMRTSCLVIILYFHTFCLARTMLAIFICNVFVFSHICTPKVKKLSGWHW